MSPMTIPVEVVDRKTIMVIEDLERGFVERWLESGEGRIPRMPHRPGKPVKFRVSRVREWLETYFEENGEPKAETKEGRRK